jgi:hypothetical protein
MIIQIPVTLPESFETALGYPGDSKWVAFYWEPCGDESMYNDGLSSGDGNWTGFLSFVRHSKVRPWLAGYNLGASDCDADHWLLCDLINREVFVGTRQEIGSFILDHLKKSSPEVFTAPPVELTPENMEALLESIRECMKEIPTPSMEEVEERMRKDQEAVEKMVSELG